MARMIMAAFADPAQADQALVELERFGYAPAEISVITRDNNYNRDATIATAEDHADARTDATTAESDTSTRAGVGETALAGATTGAALGGLMGLLAGVGVFPALAGLFIGGPIAAALGLAGAAATTVSGAVTGAAAGGLIGALAGLGVPRDKAESYDRTVSNGGVVIGLSTRDTTRDEVHHILEQHGAQDITEFDAHPQPETAPLNAEGPVTAETTAPAPRRYDPAFGERRTVEHERRTIENPREREED